MTRFAELLDDLQADPDVARGMTFGHVAAKLGKKVFAWDFDGELVVKLGAERVDQLVADGLGTRFDPMGGRPMKAWLQVGEDADWYALTDEAKAFVATGG